MKEIPLTQGKVALVDDEDYDFLMQWKWVAHKKYSDNTFYARRTINSRLNGKKVCKTIMMHRVILNVENNCLIDHIDHNGTNNTKSNLRICNRSQNGINRLPKNEYIGVTKLKNGKYQAQIKSNGKYYYLGIYDKAIDAAVIRDKHAKELFGEYALLNIKPKEDKP